MHFDVSFTWIYLPTLASCCLKCFTVDRSVEYKINGFYQNHFTVFADVVSVHLDLSTDHLELESNSALMPETSKCLYKSSTCVIIIFFTKFTMRINYRCERSKR
jgi:hypothetical protein